MAGTVAARTRHHHTGSRAIARRTILSASPELQLLLKLAAAIGAENVWAAEALLQTGCRFEAAVLLLQQWICQGCGWGSPMKAATPEDERPLWSEEQTSTCPRCKGALTCEALAPATLRQRVHRMQKRIREVLGPGFEMAKRTRAVVTFGAEERGVFRVAPAAASSEGDEE